MNLFYKIIYAGISNASNIKSLDAIFLYNLWDSNISLTKEIKNS